MIKNLMLAAVILLAALDVGAIEPYRTPTGRIYGRAYQNYGGYSYYNNNGYRVGSSYVRGNTEYYYGNSGRYLGNGPKVSR